MIMIIWSQIPTLFRIGGKISLTVSYMYMGFMMLGTWIYIYIYNWGITAITSPCGDGNFCWNFEKL
jgi:hypothetical protein